MSGRVGPLKPSFINTYSLDFDGVDDYVDCGDSDTFSFGNGSTDSPFSISAWVKMDDATTFRIASKYTNTDREYIFTTDSSDRLSFALYDLSSGGRIQRKYNTALTSFQGQWINVVGTYDGNSLSSGILLYLNGTRVDDLDGNLGSYTAMENTTQPFEIGRNNLTSFANGKIDELSVFDKALTPTEITSISSAPTDLSDLSPVAWYRMGDNGSYKSPQWLLPNNENKDKVSNYSFEFDGVDDNLYIGTALNLGTDSTISMWIKRGRTSAYEVVLSEASYLYSYLFEIGPANQLYFRINTVYLTFYSAGISSIISDTVNWINICFVRSGNSVELFLNGNSMQVLTGVGSVIDTRFDRIGSWYNNTYAFQGNIDEVAAWNTNTINPTDIYNGGTPTTIPSGAVAHYKMGEEATFSGGVWTVPDSVGSNDGTSANMTIEDRVGTAPSSSNNALSFNMDLIDRVPDTPPT